MNETTLTNMEELKNIRQSEDVILLGSINLIYKDSQTEKKSVIHKEIMVSVEKSEKGKLIFRFYDENQELIAFNLNDGRGLQIASDYVGVLNAKENVGALKTLKEMKIIRANMLSYKKEELVQISEELDISKEQIRDIESISYDKEENKEDDKINLKEENEAIKKDENKIKALEKQETNLSQKVDDVHTLGEILGVPEGGTLVAVYSDNIENGNIQNTTRFSFLIKDKHGKYKECPNLEQISGTTPSAEIAVSNSDGSNVQTQQVNSMYRIKNVSNIEYVLTVNIGSHGIIELGIGQRDKTKGNNGTELTTVTTPLKTTSIYHSTAEVREDLNGTRDGTYQSTRRVLEGETHSKFDCKKDRDEFDGELDTGHIHEDISYSEQEFYEIALDILEKSDIISEVYNKSDIVKNLEIVNQEQPELTAEDLSEIVQASMEESALQEHTHQR